MYDKTSLTRISLQALHGLSFCLASGFTILRCLRRHLYQTIYVSFWNMCTVSNVDNNHGCLPFIIYLDVLCFFHSIGFSSAFVPLNIIIGHGYDLFNKNFRSRQWRSSLPGLRTRDPMLSATLREWKFSGTYVCRVTFKHLPQPLRSHI